MRGSFRRPVASTGVNVVLATGISKERCDKINLGYLNCKQIKIGDYENREHEGVLVVPHAGEILHRLEKLARCPLPPLFDGACSENEPESAN